jgi:hypothetical protein
VEQDVGAVGQRQRRGLVLEAADDEAAPQRPQEVGPLGPAHERRHRVAARDERLREVRADEARRPGDRRPQIGLSYMR